MPKERDVKEKNTKDLQKNTRQRKIQLREQLIVSMLGNSAWMKPRAEFTSDQVARAAVHLANAVLVELEMKRNRL